MVTLVPHFMSSCDVSQLLIRLKVVISRLLSSQDASILVLDKERSDS